MISLSTLFRLFGGRCFYCNCETWLPMAASRAKMKRRFGIATNAPGSAKAMEYRRATREHVVRVADGGTNGWRNLVLCCRFCNESRGTTPSDEYKAVVAAAIQAGLHPNHGAPLALPKKALRRARREIGMYGPEASHAN
ncbi:HNH endonuclease [Methylorubrum sp. SB2]|uniref:HNH endonuclease n=1 Tax=Methylorubrum subtropicum TaxID=3138812 RepID=UPI00313BBDC5